MAADKRKGIPPALPQEWLTESGPFFGTRLPHRVTPPAAGETAEFAVLQPEPKAVRGRLVRLNADAVLRQAGPRDLVPGELLSVKVERAWRHGGTVSLVGEIVGRRIDVHRLGLRPLPFVYSGTWDPEEEYWGEEDDELPEWARPIVARGPRPMYEMDQVVPGDDPNEPEADPIIRSIELREVGRAKAARTLLYEMLRQDLRCIDAHVHLGNLVFDDSAEAAQRHYEIGVGIAELGIDGRFDGVVPWGMIDNRPYLRAWMNLALCHWRLGRFERAGEMLTRLLWLNPSDNQGARFLIEPVRRRETWRPDAY